MVRPTFSNEIRALSFLESYPGAPENEIYGASGYKGKPNHVISNLQSKDMIKESENSGWELTRHGHRQLEDFYIKQSDMKII
jgi:hypothetical protein